MKIKNITKTAFIKNLTKAYTEGIYCDSPANRKLGRVGMTYTEYAEKVKNKDSKEWEEQNTKSYESYKETIKKYSKEELDEEIASINKYIKTFSNASDEAGKKYLAYYKKIKEIAQVAKENLENEEREKEVAKINNLLENSKVLNEAKQATLDAIIDYSNSANEEGVEGIQISKDASNKNKKLAIVKFYREAAEDNVEDFDSILEDALADYTPKKI